MEERQLRQWIERVKDGTVTRREFTRMVVGLGLTAPMAAQMLASAGVASLFRRRRPQSERRSWAWSTFRELVFHSTVWGDA